MSPIYREIVLEWNGAVYTVTPTYQLIQRIEQRVSLASLLNRVINGDPPLSQLADVTAICLQAAGCKDKDATAENINAELYDEKNARVLTRAATDIVLALLPQKIPRGNAGAPKDGGGRSVKSPGENITKSLLDISVSNQASSGE